MIKFRCVECELPFMVEKDHTPNLLFCPYCGGDNVDYPVIEKEPKPEIYSYWVSGYELDEAKDVLDWDDDIEQTLIRNGTIKARSYERALMMFLEIIRETVANPEFAVRDFGLAKVDNNVYEVEEVDE